jgi:putative FmdB family regulatory protein
MPVCEYQCMECKMDFTINVSDREVSQNPKICCPHCGAEHAHVIASAGCVES